MKSMITLFAFLLLGSASADVKIPNSKVSYKLKTDALMGANASMVFVDAVEDPSGKTYVAFACDFGDAYFRLYSKSVLGSYSGEKVDIYLRADNGVLKQGLSTLREDNQTGRLTVLETKLTPSAQALGIFLSSQTKVVIRIDRNHASALTYTFPVNGFTQAYRAIKSCD